MNKEIVDINYSKVESYIQKSRPPKELRDQVDLKFTFEKNTFELYEVRPLWNKPDEFQKLPFAKIRYYKSRKVWNLYWIRASGKWELYEPLSESRYIDALLECVEEDVYGCFLG